MTNNLADNQEILAENIYSRYEEINKQHVQRTSSDRSVYFIVLQILVDAFRSFCQPVIFESLMSKQTASGHRTDD